MRTLLSFILSSIFLLSSCNSNEIVKPTPELNRILCSEPKCDVGISFINTTFQNFDQIEFEYYVDGKEQTFFYHSLAAGETTEYVYISKLQYLFYNEDIGIYFGKNYRGEYNNEEYSLYSGFGFCGTGLMFKEIEEGHFSITISNVDIAKELYGASQKRDD